MVIDYSLTFWGVRGSIACPTPRHVGFGGNTSCIEVSAGGHTIILDAGTGLRELGKHLVATGTKSATLLLTHTHWDHINGFPFFAPAFRDDFELRIMAGHLRQGGGVRTALEGQMAQPMFPVPLENIQAGITFEDFDAGSRLDLGHGITAKTAALNHPNGATGYRIEFGGKSLAYITDTEHIPGSPDQNVLGLMENADLVIYDSTYTDDEFPAKVGWGHSTWQEGVRLCKQANAKRLAIFHHDPDHDDEFMEQVEQDAKATCEAHFVAREGVTVEI